MSKIILVGNLGRATNLNGPTTAPLAGVSRSKTPIAASANDSQYSESMRPIEKEFSTLQARCALHAYQLKVEPYAPSAASWFRIVSKEGRAGIFVNMDEVKAFVNRLDCHVKAGTRLA